MNNATISDADGATHLKVVAVSLMASIIVLAVTLAARMPSDDISVRTQAQIAHGPVIKAGKPIVSTTNDTTAIR
jgi:hypothetical protein